MQLRTLQLELERFPSLGKRKIGVVEIVRDVRQPVDESAVVHDLGRPFLFGII